MIDRIEDLPEEHRECTYRFRYRLGICVDHGRLTQEQSDIVFALVYHLGAYDFSAANTGNLEDLFFYTLIDTNDPCQAFAQLVADSDKRVHLESDTKFIFPLVDPDGNRKTHVGDLEGFSDLDRMLVAHTLIAFEDPKRKWYVQKFASATYGPEGGARLQQLRMALHSQHMPSSTFVMARLQGHYPWVKDAYLEAGYSEWVAENAQQYYIQAAEFNPEWENYFQDDETPHSIDFVLWQNDLYKLRKGLPPELKYQLRTDKVTNFFPGTMQSGKWVDILVAQGDVESPQDIPRELAKLINRYSLEYRYLERRPVGEIIDLWIKNNIQDFGICFDREYRAVPVVPTQYKADLMIVQFNHAQRAKSS